MERRMKINNLYWKIWLLIAKHLHEQKNKKTNKHRQMNNGKQEQTDAAMPSFLAQYPWGKRDSKHPFQHFIFWAGWTVGGQDVIAALGRDVNWHRAVFKSKHRKTRLSLSPSNMYTIFHDPLVECTITTTMPVYRGSEWNLWSQWTRP